MTELATFGAGCFWGVESAFRTLPAVLDVKVGYEGGMLPNPSYKDVCTDRTGHAEVAQVSFDPAVLPYERLLEAFWNMHDPTTLNRQGPDMGHQYRSVIFFHNPEQEAAARKSKEEAQKFFDRKIVTEIVPETHFWRAEEYHQRYFDKHPGHYSCHFNRGWVPATPEEAKPA